MQVTADAALYVEMRSDVVAALVPVTVAMDPAALDPILKNGVSN